MTTLYRPVLIESAEQAEALPAMALCLGEGTWCRRHDPAEYRPPLPFQALVPIEAEEETHSIQTRGQTTPEWRTRLVTPWEEA